MVNSAGAQSRSRVKSTSGLGIAALVLGIIAALGCWIPFLNVISMFLAALGLLFAFLGLLGALIGRRSGAGMPLSGGIVCLVSLVVAVGITGASVGSGVNIAEEAARELAAEAAREREATGEQDAGEGSAKEGTPRPEAPRRESPKQESRRGGDEVSQARADGGESPAQTSRLDIACQVLDEKVVDVPVKAQIVRELLVSGRITEDGLKDLLRRQFLELQNRRGFKYHSRPTNIFLYAYTDRERASSGMGQWVAMLSKVGQGAKPETKVNQRQIQQLETKAATKFGLPEEKRILIWKHLVWAEDRARKEAERRFPLEPANSLAVGKEFRLSKTTPLMPELDPADSMAAIARIRRLPPGTTIRVLQVAEKRGTPWYRTRTRSASGTDLGTGWINSIALVGQAQSGLKEQINKQLELRERLERGYRKELGRQRGLSAEQLRAIVAEGAEKDWPYPTGPPTPVGPITTRPKRGPGAEVKKPAEAAATSRLNMAKLWIGAGRKDKAVAILKELIQEHPDSEAAKKARELLAGR